MRKARVNRNAAPSRDERAVDIRVIGLLLESFEPEYVGALRSELQKRLPHVAVAGESPSCGPGRVLKSRPAPASNEAGEGEGDPGEAAAE